ncbi:hypothetical protein APR09_006353 [Nocardia amikacinitolerans]|nr:hypothetical protein [Nocardia amikacinitolerans]
MRAGHTSAAFAPDRARWAHLRIPSGQAAGYRRHSSGCVDWIARGASEIELTSALSRVSVESFDTIRPGSAAQRVALRRGRDDEEQAMTESGSSNGSAEEVKRKFREALEKKNAQHAKSTDHLDGHSKATAAHGNASHKREFRRKSG